MNWDNVIKKVSPYIVKIDTPTGSGTGFLCGYNEDKSICFIATANHVISDAEEWQQPIKIYNHALEKTTFLKESVRVIFPDLVTDSAVICCAPNELDFPKEPIPLLPMDITIEIGVEVGWVGYPSIESNTLCFFSGSVSARRKNRSAYLIDGVAINGVSGGPVIFRHETDGAQIVGIISAYHANRQGGDALPGLLIAQDVSHFHKVIQSLKSLAEAKKKKAEEAAKPAPPPPPPPAAANPEPSAPSAPEVKP
jgi:hypothetical protein